MKTKRMKNSNGKICIIFLSMHKTGWPCLKENPSLREEPPTSMEIIPKVMKAQLKTWIAFQYFMLQLILRCNEKIVFSLPPLGPQYNKDPSKRNQGKAYGISYNLIRWALSTVSNWAAERISSVSSLEKLYREWGNWLTCQCRGIQPQILITHCPRIGEATE